jgi:L-amino acid N-acyltransferase YncA
LDTYPKTVRLRATTALLRPLAHGDAEEVLVFARSLPAHDLMFLRRDITKPETVAHWLEEVDQGLALVVIAEIDGRMAGYGMLSLNDLDWSRHLAELRVLVHPDFRETGLGRAMIREVFALAVNRGVEKVIARMTLDQTSARSLFQELGFRPEALHENEVKDRAGKLHDVLRMAVDVQALLARRDSYGLG